MGACAQKWRSWKRPKTIEDNSHWSWSYEQFWITIYEAGNLTHELFKRSPCSWPLCYLSTLEEAFLRFIFIFNIRQRGEKCVRNELRQYSCTPHQIDAILLILHFMQLTFEWSGPTSELLGSGKTTWYFFLEWDYGIKRQKKHI